MKELNNVYRAHIQFGKDAHEKIKMDKDSFNELLEKAKEIFKEPKNPKILFWDVETSMMLGGFFGLYNQDINFCNVIQDWFIISVQWSWDDQKKVNTASVLDDMKAFDKDHTDDAVVIKKIHEILTEADIVVHHNGDKFDIKKFNARAIVLGLEPIAESKTVDTLKEARKIAKFSSNRLGDLCDILEIEVKKLKVGMPNAWIKATTGCQDAVKAIVKYGKGDIPTLRAVYMKLRPYMKMHPNMNLYLGTSSNCKKCGSEDTIHDGKQFNRTTTKLRIKCRDCGGRSVTNIIIDRAKVS